VRYLLPEHSPTPTEATMSDAIEFIRELADELASEVEARYEFTKNHPVMKRRYDRDMDTVIRARAFLAAESPKPEQAIGADEEQTVAFEAFIKFMPSFIEMEIEDNTDDETGKLDKEKAIKGIIYQIHDRVVDAGGLYKTYAALVGLSKPIEVMCDAFYQGDWEEDRDEIPMLDAYNALKRYEAALAATRPIPVEPKEVDLIREQFTGRMQVNIPTREKMGLPPVSKPGQAPASPLLRHHITRPAFDDFYEGSDLQKVTQDELATSQSIPQAVIKQVVEALEWAKARIYVTTTLDSALEALKPYVDGDLSKVEGAGS
jgi:hypothetical protein